jgi:putative methyltransferase (TIGR04325 family)
MSAAEIARTILASEPCRTVLARMEASASGRKLLNSLSNGGGVFSTFEEGWSAARKIMAAGHEHPSEIRVHLELSRDLRASDYAVLYWLSRMDSRDLRIFDFGGNVGNLFYSYSPYLRDSFNIYWTVFDLPSIIEEGKRIAAERNALGLGFTNSVTDVSETHLLLVSGTFHYWESSIEAFLQHLGKLPEHVIVNRSPILERQSSFITVQRTRFCAFPCIVRNARETVSAFAAMGYTLVDRWPALELSLRLPLFPTRSVPHYSGFYFRRQQLR